MLSLLAQNEPRRVIDACGQDPGPICRRVLESTGDRDLASLASFLLDKPLTILLILIVAFVTTRIVRRSIKKGLRKVSAGGVGERLGRRRPMPLSDTGELSIRSEQRIESLASVLRSGASFVIWLIAAFLVLGQLGVDLGPLLAGAGVIGVALGFGSQSLVRDFLSGMFILIEDQFGVGDIVDLDLQTSGTVEAVSLRTTRLRSVDGTVWHVPNGDIRRVGNKSQHWSRALLDVEVAYDTDIEQAKSVIKGVADELWHEREDILEEPEVWGVERLGPNAIVIRLVVKTRPADQYNVSRQLRQRLKEAFDAEGIEIPFPQQVVWHRTVPDPEPAGDDP